MVVDEVFDVYKSSCMAVVEREGWDDDGLWLAVGAGTGMSLSLQTLHVREPLVLVRLKIEHRKRRVRKQVFESNSS